MYVQEQGYTNVLQYNRTGYGVIFDSQVGFNQGAYKYPDGSVVTLRPRKSTNDHVITVFKAVKLFWRTVSLKSISDGLRTLKNRSGNGSIRGPAKLQTNNLSEGVNYVACTAQQPAMLQPWFGWPAFNLRPVHWRFVVENVAVGQVSLRAFWFPFLYYPANAPHSLTIYHNNRHCL
jgi:hypothetical protein